MNIVLASQSPRRRKILQDIGLSFKIVRSDYEESLPDNNFSYKKIETLALNKAKGAINNIKEPCLIISADTVVVLNNTILGKPKNFDDAYKMLSDLSGKTHKVVTSLCIMDSSTQEYKINSTTTLIEFFKLTNKQIIDYINKFSPFDKAGAYGIQELPQGFVKSTNGDIENVIGLSSESVKSTLALFQ